MSETQKPPYKVEYAKSNRSKCVECKEQIDKETVRVGKLERSDKFDGEFYCWRHPDCFFSNYSPTFDELKVSPTLPPLYPSKPPLTVPPREAPFFYLALPSP